MGALTGPSGTELVELVAALVGIPSLSGEEAEAQRFIASWLEERGVPVDIETTPDGLVNVTAEIGGRSAGPVLFLGGHCDTVGPAPGWSTDPFAPTIRGGRLYGLGAIDMKSGLAAAMAAVADLAACREAWDGTIVFASLADEEARSRGARAFLERSRAIDLAVMVEPHFDDPVAGAIGKLNIRVDVRGRSAHGSRPQEGVSAVTEAARLVVALGEHGHALHPRHGQASHCVLGIHSGDGRYEIRVPDRCEFLVNWHLMPGESAEGARAAVQELAGGLASPAHFEIEIVPPFYESFSLGDGEPLLAAFASSYAQTFGGEPAYAFGSGVSDANLFNAAGIPTLLFGPRGANLHAADEWVDLDSVHQVRETLRSLRLGLGQHLTKGFHRAA